MKRIFSSLCSVFIVAYCLGGPSAASAGISPEVVVCDAGNSQAVIYDTTTPSPTPTPVPIPPPGVTQELKSTIGPATIAITPDATQAWITNDGTHSVSVIELATHTLLTTIPVGSAPIGIAITPDGTQAWVCNDGDNTVSVIDTKSLSIVGSAIPVGNEPSGIAITTDGKQAWVCNSGGNTISIIDTKSLTVVPPSIAVDDTPLFIAVTPNGKEAWVTNFASDSISVIDIATRAIDATISLPVNSHPYGIGISPDGKQAWVCDNATNAVSVIDIGSRTIVYPAISVGVGPQFLAVAPGTNWVWETNSNDQTLGIIKSPAHPIDTSSMGTGAVPRGIAITPDQAPTARFTSSISGATVSFDASASSSPYGGIASYTWDFGDGSPQQTVAVPQISHTYATGISFSVTAPGSFTVTLTVTNTQGTSTTQTFTGQTVSNNGGPSARFSQPVTISTNFAPSKFKGKPKIKEHAKKLLLKTKWTQSGSPTVNRYKIYAHNKKIASISARHDRKYTLRLHPQHFPHKHLSKDYKRYLDHKYSIRAVNANGTVSTATPLRVVR